MKNNIDIKKILLILKSLAKEDNVEIIHLSIQSLIEDIEGV